jgi:hypothetical protein
MKTTLIFSFFSFVFAVNASAQTKEQQSSVLYAKAEDKYTAIQKTKASGYPYYYYMKDRIKDYDEVINALSEAQKLIGTKPKLTYLFVKAVYEAVNEGAYPKTKGQYELILRYIDSLKIDANYPKEKADEIAAIKLDAQAKLNDPKIIAPFASREDALAYIAATIKKYNINGDETSKFEILDVSWDNENLYVLGTSSSGIDINRFLYVMNIPSLKKAEGEAENPYRVNDHYVFADNKKSVYVWYTNLKQRFLKIKTASEFYLKHPTDAPFDKGTEKMDIFLNCYSGSSWGSIAPGNSDDISRAKDKKFHDEAEADYVKAWDYLYTHLPGSQ